MAPRRETRERERQSGHQAASYELMWQIPRELEPETEVGPSELQRRSRQETELQVSEQGCELGGEPQARRKRVGERKAEAPLAPPCPGVGNPSFCSFYHFQRAGVGSRLNFKVGARRLRRRLALYLAASGALERQSSRVWGDARSGKWLAGPNFRPDSARAVKWPPPPPPRSHSSREQERAGGPLLGAHKHNLVATSTTTTTTTTTSSHQWHRHCSAIAYT